MFNLKDLKWSRHPSVSSMTRISLVSVLTNLELPTTGADNDLMDRVMFGRKKFCIKPDLKQKEDEVFSDIVCELSNTIHTLLF